MPSHSSFLGGPPPPFAGQPLSHAHCGAHSGRRGRRPIIDPVVVGRAPHEVTGFGKDALNRSIKMSVPATMGPNSDFKRWKRNFLTFMSLKAAHLTPQLAIRESGSKLDERAQHYAYALLLHAARENKRADQAMKCVSVARPDCATGAWDILCERLDCRSSARSLSWLDNLMLMQRHGPYLTDYVHLRQTFDDYNEICELTDGSAAIHPHNLGLFILRGISSNGPFGQVKQCVINAFDTNYLFVRQRGDGHILHLEQNMDEEVTAPGLPASNTSAPPISAFVGVARGSSSGRGHIPRGTRCGRGLPNKCSACGSLNHIMSSCIALDDDLLKWPLAKGMMIVQKYGTHGGSASRTQPYSATSLHTTLTSCPPSRNAHMNTMTVR
jgi:hypothetical protein